MSLNHIVLVGTIDRQPEKRVTAEGMGTTTFKLKVQRPARNAGAEGEDGAESAAAAGPARGERFDFISVFAVRRMADLAAELRAGETVAVEGRLETFALPGEQYKNGVRVFADSISRLSAGAPTAETNGYAAEPAAVGAGAAAASQELPEDLDDSIPF
jgi:single-stranded DNA-binding protein